MVAQDRYPKYLEDQRAVFDAMITEDWNTYLSRSWDETRRYEIRRLFERIKPSTVLDIGCGCGFHDYEMASYPFVTRIDAIDYSSKSVKRAEEAYAHPKVVRWVADFANEPQRRNYDLVVSFQVFEHLKNWEVYLQFCREACVQGGHVAVFTPNRLRLSNRSRIWRGLAPELIDTQHFKEYTVRELVELGRKCGFLNHQYFGYGLSGNGIVDRLNDQWRLRLGGLFPAISSGICVILRAPGGDKNAK